MQEQLTLEADIDLPSMRGIERGRRNPSLPRIADALSVPLPKLLSKSAGSGRNGSPRALISPLLRLAILTTADKPRTVILAYSRARHPRSVPFRLYKSAEPAPL